MFVNKAARERERGTGAAAAPPSSSCSIFLLPDLIPSFSLHSLSTSVISAFTVPSLVIIERSFISCI